MKKKLLGIFVCMLLITTILPSTVIAGDEDNPEIEDEINDTILKHFDIVSAWFHENTEEPDYLFISMKVTNLRRYWMGGAYLVEWKCNTGRYASSAILGTSIRENWRCGDYSDGENTQFTDLPPCEGSFDKSNNILTWKISKNQIGNPQPGTELTETRAGSCITGKFLMLLPLRGLPRFHDYGPDEGYGKDYIIQY